MRNIQVSTDVFSAIWSKRELGEDTEDSILKRLLGCEIGTPVTKGRPANVTSGSGVFDARNGVTFSEGFQIIRSYKGQEYVAEARSGAWHRLDNGQAFRTLNQLNSSIAAGSENAWNGSWKYRNEAGIMQSIDLFRKQQ